MNLKNILHGELHDPRTIDAVEDSAERVRIRQTYAGVRTPQAVRDIERLGTNFQLLAFPNLE